ncbi:MAG: hypothetical protein Q7U53_14380 [Anaerolineaceae bacterium]|nr:hypothetical protein [Anaerolineaceae bacterium]
MAEYSFKLPIGDYYLIINSDQQDLHQRLKQWFQFAHNTSNLQIGTISIFSTDDDFSSHSPTPTTEWQNQDCHYFARGCKGIVGANDLAILWVNFQIDLIYIELFIRVVTAIRIFNLGGLLVHAAGLERNNQGYLFTGPSGAGKTTVCRVSTDCNILNDDMVILYPGSSSWIISATPFWNPTQVPPGTGSVPLHMILHLKQAKQHKIENVSFSKAIADLLTHIPAVSQNPLHTSLLLQRCSEIVTKAVVRELQFLPDSGFWKLLNQGNNSMSEI